MLRNILVELILTDTLQHASTAQHLRETYLQRELTHLGQHHLLQSQPSPLFPRPTQNRRSASMISNINKQDPLHAQVSLLRSSTEHQNTTSSEHNSRTRASATAVHTSKPLIVSSMNRRRLDHFKLLLNPRKKANMSRTCSDKRKA